MPKAIFTPSGNLLEEVLSYLVKTKIDPNQLYLCSYDYNNYLNYSYYPIDAIIQDIETMALTCVDVIDDLLNFNELKHHAFFIEPQIIRHR